MTVSVGDYVYALQTTPLDNKGVAWLHLERRKVLQIAAGIADLSGREVDVVPTHSAALEGGIHWYADNFAQDRVAVDLIDTGGSRYVSTLDLPELVEIDEAAVRAAWLAFTNHRFDNRERGKPAPQPADANQVYQFAVLEWRDGLPKPSSG
jgi:hypothetical protein